MLRWRRSRLRIGQATSAGDSPAVAHLVEQWLKEVMVLPVDQGNVRRRLGKPLRDSQADEAGADDDHARALALHVVAAIGYGRAHKATDALNSSA